MDDDKKEYIFQLIEIIADMGLSTLVVEDEEGDVRGLVIGEHDFVEDFSFDSNKNKTYH